jgi:cystathionine beta-lyase
MGYSWGGYESLLLPTWPEKVRSLPFDKKSDGPLIRLNIGLEDPKDLIDDLAQAFSRYQNQG